MMKRIMVVALIACVLLASWISTGCTRAKPETPAPTPIAGQAVTQTPLPSLTPTEVLTPQPPPTTIPLTPGPTVISVAEVSPTPIPTAIPTVYPTAVATPVPGQFEYTVQWGDTLYSLARRFNTTVDALVALNGLPNPNYIRVGQVLKITGTPPPSTGTAAEYTVQPGDTLFSIARRYNTTVEAISRANGIVNPWYIRVGQKLVIPQGGTSTTPSGGSTYVVQPGDTLYSIAARFGKNIWDIVAANNLSDPYWIWVGQVLTIP
ncbi:MAG: LysM peptidoglycan-binding domain-containing protein [Chloroflexi bacterium]|nr:LysM peptidoglycan-binding domain-containing protein [Chloroflexota bacterium]